MNIDVYEELNALEISLRGIITSLLAEKHGPRWFEDHLKVSEERKDTWKKRHSEESVSLKGGALDARMIYYADFYDLGNIIDKHWDDGFKKVFSDRPTINVFLEQLRRLRDPSAHNRSLHDYQKHLIKGISWELRTRIMMYRGKKDDPSDYFPVIELIRDSLGNSMSAPIGNLVLVSTVVCHVGDSVDISVQSIDPQGGELEYWINQHYENHHIGWQPSPTRSITFTERDIGIHTTVYAMVRTQRDYHAQGNWDAIASIRYVVLPNDATATV